jgi:hypothetical protein
VAALGISGPTSRLADRLEELGRNLVTRAAEVATVQQASNTLTKNLTKNLTKEGVA